MQPVNFNERKAGYGGVNDEKASKLFDVFYFDLY